MSLPKFVDDDVPLFLGLINELFPANGCLRIGHQQLTTAVRDDLTSHRYHHSNETLFDLEVDQVMNEADQVHLHGGWSDSRRKVVGHRNVDKSSIIGAPDDTRLD